jgi:tetratricopeptide (TPR) repeat protein
MMKKVTLLTVVLFTVLSHQAQLNVPKASPLCTYSQRVGLTDISLSYSRPAVNNRRIFGDLIPFDAYWRLGANENTKITTTDVLIFGKDTLAVGTYALFAKPGQERWTIAFYRDYNNWGVPDPWDSKKVALELTAPIQLQAHKTENLTLGIDEIGNNGAVFFIAWDNVRVNWSFNVNTMPKVKASIDKVMAGPTPNDYHAAAKYYYDEKIDNEKALEWVNLALKARPEAYWMLRTKSLIQASLGQYKEAILTAESCIKLAEADGDIAYVSQCKNSIIEWKKQK